jgi:dihydroorotate dehydrogenase (NAD+) catalytic subunit
MAPAGNRFDCEHPGASEAGQAGGEIRMLVHPGKIVVIESRAAQAGIIDRETERAHEMQGRTRVGAEPDDVAGVLRDLGFEQDHVEHRGTVPFSCAEEKGPVPSYDVQVHAPPPAPSLALDFCELKFASPIVLLSGCVGFGEEYTRVAGFSNRDAGAIVLKGTTGKARLGNPPHRVTETPMGMINAIGLQNPGVDHVVRHILPTLDFSETRFIANVCGSTIDEYVEVTRRFDDSPIDAMEINISCPNVKEGGVQFGNYPEMSARVVAACRKVTVKPLITKLSPNQTDIRENARLCIEAGSDALAVINTISGMAIDPKTRRPVIGNVQGGLSGPAIKPIALLMVKKVYEVAGPKRVPIIGQGGITTVGDAIEFLIAGATAVGIGTSLFYDPLLCPKINAGIADYLRTAGLASVSELAGTLVGRSMEDCG